MKTAKNEGREIGQLLIVWSIVTGLLLAGGGEGVARVNMPQQHAAVDITGQDHNLLRDFFLGLISTDSVDLTADMGQLLLRIVPELYRSGCEEVVSHWGMGAADTDDLSVRIIHVSKPGDGRSCHVLLAYRCFSHYEYYVDRFYDERLAVIAIGDDASKLQILPHGEDCENCLDLSRIALEGSYEVEGKPLIGVSFSVSSDNPCCNGGSSYSEEIIGYYLIDVGGARQVASAKKRGSERHESIDDDGEFATWAGRYNATVTFQEDSNTGGAQIISEYIVEENGQVTERGTERYVWNSDTGLFDRATE